MTNHVSNLIGLPLAAFLLAVISLPLMKRLATHYGIISAPYSDTLPARRVPLLGGIAIILSILVPLSLAGAMPLWIGAPTLALLIVGVIDDAVAMRPLKKFLLQLLIVIAVVLAAPRFALAPWRLLNLVLAGFFLVSTVNAFNLIDGLDGLAGGVGIAAALAAAGVAGLHDDMYSVVQGLVIAGALAGFLVYNLHPASIFMGDGGALPLGLLLGIVALHVGGLSGNSRLPHYVVPIMIMLVPLLDTAIVTVSRIATGAPISRRGLDHSHHRLLALGLSDESAVALCWGVALLAGFCAMLITMMPRPYLVATLPFMVVAFGLVGLFMIDLTFDANSPSVVYGYLQGMARLIVAWTYKRRMAEVLLDLIVIPAAFFGAFLLRLDFTIDEGRVASILSTLPWIMVGTYAAFMIAGVYRGIWRYAGISDVVRFANGSILVGIFISLIALVKPLALSGSITLLYVILLFNLLVASRFSFQALRKGVALMAASTDRVLIVGAGALGVTAAEYLASAPGQIRVIGFVDDDNFKSGKLVHGRPVLGSINDLEVILARTWFNQILFAAESLGADRVALLWDLATRRKITIRHFSIGMSEVEAISPETGEQHAPETIPALSGRPVAVTRV
jgi:UDP-GlcNAc:undecaprenyl-phosphate/decaprenyl-phosphate GlcNAc-1-phosphate transferase